METWIANKETLYSHIKEKVMRTNTRRMLYLKGHMTKDDMVSECWMEVVDGVYKEAAECMAMYDGRIVTEYLQNKIIRKRASVCVEYWIHRTYKKIRTKIKKESPDMKRKYHEHIEWSKLTRRSFKDVISSINISREENIIMLWKMDLIDDADAMAGLECSERTLYNRWDKLREKFIEALVADPLKSLELFSRVHEIPMEME